MKKFIFILLLIFILPISSITLFRHQEYAICSTSTDSGFDSDYDDYDGGSWGGGGSSWGNDNDNNYNNNYSNNYGGSYGSGSYDGSSSSEDIMPIIIIPILMIVALIVASIVIKCRQKRKNAEQYIYKTLYYDYFLEPGEGADSEIIQSAYLNYVEIQKAWMNRDLSNVRHLLTDEMYNMYQMQIETLIEDDQINVMSNFEFVCGRVQYMETTNNDETYKIILCVNCKDYIKSASNNKVISGKKNATITYIYELTFIRNTNSNKAINCPSCGALVDNQMSATCPYCNNSLLLTSSSITLSNKQILKQFKR